MVFMCTHSFRESLKVDLRDTDYVESKCPNRIRDELQREYDETITYHRRRDTEIFGTLRCGDCFRLYENVIT